ARKNRCRPGVSTQLSTTNLWLQAIHKAVGIATMDAASQSRGVRNTPKCLFRSEQVQTWRFHPTVHDESLAPGYPQGRRDRDHGCGKPEPRGSQHSKLPGQNQADQKSKDQVQ